MIADPSVEVRSDGSLFLVFPKDETGMWLKVEVTREQAHVLALAILEKERGSS